MDLMQIFTLVTGVVYIVLEIRQKNFMWGVGIATSLTAMWVYFLLFYYGFHRTVALEAG